MFLGMSLATFTFFHVLISLVGIGSGLIVMFGFLTRKQLAGWNAVFLLTTVLTSATGFLFPFHKFLPSHGVGIVSLIALAVAIFALYGRSLAGAWRRTYVVSAVMALYLNVFVLIVQLFEKVHALRALAPTQSEPPFKFAQLFALVIFVLLGIFAAKKFANERIPVA
jgi:hypothetical protein